MEPVLLALPTARLVTWTWAPPARRLAVPTDAAVALGPQLAHAIQQPDWAFVHLEDLAGLEASLARCATTGRAVEHAFRAHPSLSRDVRWLDLHATRTELPGGPVVQGILIDSTRRRDAESEWQRQETRHRLIMDSAREYAILVTDRDGTITGWSVGAERLFGYSEQEAVGLPAAALFTPEDRAAGVPAWELTRAITDGRSEDERWHMRRDGSRFFGSGLLMPMDTPGVSASLLKILRDRTADEQARQAVAESQERLRLATEAAGLGVFEWNTVSRTALGENARIYEIFGRRPDEGPLDEKSLAPRVVPDDLAALKAAVRHAATGAPLHTTFRLEEPQGGGFRHLEIWGGFRPDASGARTRLIGVVADVTKSRAREEAVLASEARFRLATAAVNGLIYDMNLVTGETWRSESLQSLIGVSPEEAPPSSDWWLGRMHPDDRLAAAERYAQAAAGETTRYSVEYRVRHEDGHYVQVWDQGLVERGPDGRPVRMLGCSVDVTAQRAAEAALVEADRRKDAFLATLAHELRNPLAPIRHALEILRRAESGSPTAQRARDVMERQLSQMVRLIDDLLDLSRITLGKIGLRRETLPITEVVRSAVETCQPMLEASGQRLTVTLPDAPVTVQGDLTRLAQVLTNLLNNASKFSQAGAEIALRVRATSSDVSWEIEDRGSGIAADVLPGIFDMFTQGATPGAPLRGGLGVGLALVRQLVEMHGGSVDARSAGPGHGSTFTVRLPRTAAEAMRRSPTPEHDGAFTMKRVLVVDDNADSAESLSLLLELMGHVVRTAHDGEEALAQADAFRPELVLMDIGMPRMDGYEAARRLRQAPWAGEVVLVALTGWGQEEDKRRSEAAGFDRHLIKPVDPSTLGELLNHPVP